MDYHFSCECGKSVTVTEAAAGREIDCACGRSIKVPSFRELREMAGMPANHVSPALIISHLLANGELYPPADCVWCGVESDDVIHLSVECEREWKQESNTLSQVLTIVFFGWLGFLLLRRSHGGIVGKDLIFRLPITVCPKCRHRFVSESRIRFCQFSALTLLVIGAATLFLLPEIAAGCLIASLLVFVTGLIWKNQRHHALHETLRQVPLYAQLLDRYPDAPVTWFGG